MTNNRNNSGNGGRDRTYISRDEFEVFERNVDRSFENVTDAIRNLTEKIDRMGSTDWKTLGMFAGLILTIAGLAAQPFLRDLWRLERTQEALREQVSQGTEGRWTEDDEADRQVQELVETRRLEALIEKRVELMDETLQREMRLLDGNLQREMRGLLDAPLERLSDIEEDLVYWRSVLDERGQWMAETDAGRAAQAAALEARIDQLEHDVSEISAEQRRRTTHVYSREDGN